jgi:hypothetical protein
MFELILLWIEILNARLLWVGIFNTVLLLTFARNIGILKILEFGLYAPFYVVYEIPLRKLISWFLY